MSNINKILAVAFILLLTGCSIGGEKKIKIFSVEKLNAPKGFNIINWNGQNSFGDFLANGVYIYHIKASNENEKTSSLGRIAKFK